MQLNLLLFLDVVHTFRCCTYFKVVLIVDMFGEISIFHFIELNFILESLDIVPRMEGKCVFVIFRIKKWLELFFLLAYVYFFYFDILLLLESEEHCFWKVKSLLVFNSLWKGKLTAVEYYSDSV